VAGIIRRYAAPNRLAPAELPIDKARAILTQSPIPTPRGKGWRDIASAPRDLTPIIGMSPGQARQWYRWIDASRQPEGKCGWFNSEQNDWTEPQPTMWRPLPDPPPTGDTER
jgi:hypothetical protein